MSRRRVVVIASASAILGIGLLLAIAFISATQTSYGRERLRQLVLGRLEPALVGRGKVYVGRVGGDFLTGLTIDSLAIRDLDDSLFVSTGRVRVAWDPRDLIDKRVLLRSLDVQHPVVVLRRHANEEWNFNRIFRRGGPGAPSGGKGFGDYIVINNTTIRDGAVILTMPWSPDDTLRGAKRDSVIVQALASGDHEVRATAEGYKHTWRWNHIDADASYARLADPDSAGRLFALTRLDVDGTDPRLSLRNVRGPVRMLGDSVWFESRHWDMRASTGHADGKVYWGHGPIRYDVRVHADSFALDDVKFAYATLPRTGGGTGDLHIRNNARDPHVLDYALSNMDVRTTKSHLAGAMTFGVGGQVLAIKDVAMTASPVDFDFIRTLNGKPFPVDWQGQLSGTVRARGGPVNRFLVDDAQLTFRDAHVPGAITRASARGGLDILYPALTSFRGLDVKVETLDLRTIRYLYPNFPPLGGTVAGRATLDSSWLDVRFRDADLTHTDGPDTPSRATGSGRITYGEKFLRFDVDLAVSPLSFTTMARSYPKLTLRGPFTGPLRVRGTTEDLDLTAMLTGAPGTIGVDGHFDLYPPGYAASGTASVRDLSVGALLGRTDLPDTRLTATVAGSVRGDSLSDVAGALAVDIERSLVDSVRIYPSVARITLGGGRIRFDSLRLETAAATLAASGALGLTASVTDSMRYTITVDSLGGLRRFLRKPPIARGAVARADSSAPGSEARDVLAAALRDSLGGSIRMRGVLVGSIDTLSTIGTLTGSELFDGGNAALHATGRYAVAGLPGAPRATAMLQLDTVTVAGIALERVAGSLDMPTRTTGRIALDARTANAIDATAALGFTIVGDTTRFAADTFSVHMRDYTWRLAAPAHVTLAPGMISLDTIVLRNGVGGSVALRGTLPDQLPMRASVRLDSFPLADAGSIAQIRAPLGGYVDLMLDVAGTRAEPVMRLDASLSEARYGDLRLPRSTGRGTYADERVDASLQVFRDGKPALSVTGVLPIDLALVPVDTRLLPGQLSGRVRADSVDLSILEAVTSRVERAAGSLSTDVSIGGTWKQPTFAGHVGVARGGVTIPQAGIALHALSADIALARDSVNIRRLSAFSDNARGDSASLTGVIRLSDFRNPVFDLRLYANRFQALRQRKLADLEVSGRLTLTGPMSGAHVSGGMTIDRAAIYLPELAQKQLVSLSDSDAFNIIDTTLVSNQGLIPPAAPVLIKNLVLDNVRVGIGDDVWLRSREANIKLQGSAEPLEVQRVGNQFTPTGIVGSNRGTYRLDLGLVQRTFTVDTANVTFYGTPDIPPLLDISASYTVRQLNREDVKIRARISGSLGGALRLALSNDEALKISETDVLSYLVFGAPSFVVGQQASNSALRQVSAALLPTVGGVLERALTEQLGSTIDLLQIQTGSFGEDQNSQFSDVLRSTRIGAGVQIGTSTYLSANAGLGCGGSTDIGGGVTGTQLTFGASIEHRLQKGLWLQAGVDPGFASCRTKSVVQAPPLQLGFDLFREWRF